MSNQEKAGLFLSGIGFFMLFLGAYLFSTDKSSDRERDFAKVLVPGGVACLVAGTPLYFTG